MATKQTWKVGDLARQTGVSVRALHYYEEIGLLVPSGRTPAGHRVYGEADVARLQQIVSLRGVGLSLEQISEMLARPDSSPLSVIQLHIQHLRKEVEQRTALCDKLVTLATRLAERGQVSAGDFIEALRWTTMMAPLVDKYYNHEQREQLAARRAQIGETEIARVEGEWRDIFAQLRQAMTAGTDPADAAVQAIVARMAKLIEMFTGGDEGMHESLASLWHNESGPRQMMGIDDELKDYLERAQQAARGPAS